MLSSTIYSSRRPAHCWICTEICRFAGGKVVLHQGSCIVRGSRDVLKVSGKELDFAEFGLVCEEGYVARPAEKK